MLQQLISKPFEKEEELAQLKKDLSKLEREISIKIQANQMKQHNSTDENITEIKEAQVIEMDEKQPKLEKTLLPKKDMERKVKRLIV